MKHSERYERGWKKLQEIDGEAGEKVVESLKTLSPELAQYIIEYSFGDIYAREGLPLKEKEIAVVAALTAMGNARPQLKVHLNGALNTGSTISEIKEVLLQMSVYAGFPAAINGFTALQEVLAERKSQGLTDKEGKKAMVTQADRQQKGLHTLKAIAPEQADAFVAKYRNWAPELIEATIGYAYGDVYSRENLSPRYRQIATIAALTALGNFPNELAFHIKAGHNVGLTTEEIKEIMLLMTIYAGFPAAINGMNSLAASGIL
ncbi:carboxymuconolactone decarboxylase family protein [Capnocytophaga sp. HP1101]